MTGEGNNCDKSEELQKRRRTDFENFTLPKSRRRPRFVLTEEEVQRLIDSIDHGQYGVLNDSIIE